jgi:hypothetical protein
MFPISSNGGFQKSPNFGGDTSDNEEQKSLEELIEDEGCYDMVFPPQYHNNSPENTVPIDEQISEDGKIVRRY